MILDTPAINFDLEAIHPKCDPPLEYFEKVFPESLVEHIVDQTKTYAFQNENKFYNNFV